MSAFLMLEYYKCISFFLCSTVISGQALLIVEVSRSHSEAPHSIRLHWTGDQPVAETST